MNAIPLPDKIEPGEAREHGFIVDSHCYPWVAYKGPRFNPTELRNCFTDKEAELIVALAKIVSTVEAAAGRGHRIPFAVSKSITEAESLLPARYKATEAAHV